MKKLRLIRFALTLAIVGAFMGGIVQPVAAGDPPNRLDDNRGLTSSISLAGDVCTALLGYFSLPAAIGCPGMDGRVLENAKVHTIFASGDWNGSVPSMFSTVAVNDMTQSLLSSDYLRWAGQYGVGNASFEGSTVNNGCGGAPSGTTNQLSIELWITCEVQTPSTGVPYPDDNSLYVIFLPPSVDINNGPDGGTCDNFSAYHLQSMALTVSWALFVPYPHFQSYPYIVIPLKCANSTVDGLSKILSHEFIEAVTDPIGPHGWADNNTINLSGDFLKGGEAADICSSVGAVDSPFVRLDNGLLVAPYWSNVDNGCAPLTHTVTLKTVGMPTAGSATVTSLAIFNDNAPHVENLATTNTFTIVDGGHASWTFPSPVNGSPGVRYVTLSHGSDGPTPINSNVVDTANYDQQDLLTVNTFPASIGSMDASLTATQWVLDGTTVTLNTDDNIPVGGVDRYHFTRWSGDISSAFSTTSILVDGPKTATAFYVLQHNLTFDQTGIPGSVPWKVWVDGTPHDGPYSQWFDEYSYVSFVYQDPVPDTGYGTRYKFVGATTTSPLTVTATGTITATYKTQHLVTIETSGLPDPNSSTITNGAITLGTVNDTSPLAVWIDDGTVMDLKGDADVNGVDGTQYFAQSFVPVPPATLTAPLETTLTYKTMKQLIDDAIASGGISGNSAGIGVALNSEFASVEMAMGSHNYSAALGAVTAFVNTLQAQSGKAVSPNVATTLELDASLVYHAALCLASGNMSQAALQHEYSDYVQLVQSLGGEVLPPCS